MNEGVTKSGSLLAVDMSRKMFLFFGHTESTAASLNKLLTAFACSAHIRRCSGCNTGGNLW